MDGLTAEAIEKIEQMALATKRVEHVHPSGFPSHVRFQIGPSGMATELELPLPAAGIKLDTPDEFVSFVNDHLTGEVPRVFYSFNELDFVFDLWASRQDHARCTLVPTEELRWLTTESAKQMSQAAFVRVLRITLRRCFSGNGNLCSLIRNLKWTSGADTDRNIQHGKESLGRAINAEVRGEAAIPEEVVLVVPIWENFAFAASINCAIEIQPDVQQFKLTPFPGEIDRASDMALDAIANLFTEDGFPKSYRGKR